MVPCSRRAQRFIKNKKDNDFYEYSKDISFSEINSLKNFVNWVNGSIILCHNAPFVIRELEKEFFFCGLNPIPREQFRCTLRIFREVSSIIEPEFNKKDVGLIKCCNFFGIDAKEEYIQDSSDRAFFVAKLMTEIYSAIDANTLVSNEFNYNEQETLESHYESYQKIKKNRILLDNDK